MEATGEQKRVLLKWGSSKGYATIAVFTLVSILFETLVVYAFLSMGLTDVTPLIGVFRVPGTQFTFTLTVSSLFVLLPLGVILVLVSCWVYLTRVISTYRRRPQPKPAGRIRPTKGRKSTFSTRTERWANVRAQRPSEAAVRDLPGAGGTFRLRKITAWFEKRLLVRTTLRSALIVMLSFGLFVFIAYLMAYPTAIYNLVYGYYTSNPDVLKFVFDTSKDFSSAIGQIPPLQVIGYAINWVILGIAPYLWLGLGGLGGPLIQYLSSLDLVSKYVVCQNLAAWLSVILTLTYGWYLTRRRGVKQRTGF